MAIRYLRRLGKLNDYLVTEAESFSRGHLTMGGTEDVTLAHLNDEDEEIEGRKYHIYRNSED